MAEFVPPVLVLEVLLETLIEFLTVEAGVPVQKRAFLFVASGAHSYILILSRLRFLYLNGLHFFYLYGLHFFDMDPPFFFISQVISQFIKRYCLLSWSLSRLLFLLTFSRLWSDWSD